MPSPDDRWPPLPLGSWADTCATLHMWTQIVGKVRLALAPPVNHWLNEFILSYEDVRRSASPRDALLEFARRTYEAGASLGGWDRAALERQERI